MNSEIYHAQQHFRVLIRNVNTLYSFSAKHVFILACHEFLPFTYEYNSYFIEKSEAHSIQVSEAPWVSIAPHELCVTAFDSCRACLKYVGTKFIKIFGRK